MLTWNLSVMPNSNSCRKSTWSERAGSVVRRQVVQFSISRLPGADVGASYTKVKWRAPAKQETGGKIDKKKIDHTNFLMSALARVSGSSGQNYACVALWF